MYQEVTGLSVKAPVKYNGVEVGYIDSVKLNLNNPQQVVILLKIKDGTPITTSTVATLMTQGITGIAYMGLSAKSPKAPPLMAKAGERYPVIPTVPSLLLQLSSIVKTASTDATNISMSIQNMLTPENAQNFKIILSNLATVTQVLAQNEATMETMFTNSKQILANTAIATEQLPSLMQEAQRSIQQLDILTQNASTITPDIILLIDRLNQIGQNLSVVSAEMKQNPGVLVRGTKLPPLGPGEK